jgi:acetoin utilization deacetylase AcuC-like enzyme
MIHIAWSPLYNHPLPAAHRFPMLKYDLLKEQLLYEGTFYNENFFCPTKADLGTIYLAHEASYIEKLLYGQISTKEMRATGFPYSFQLVEREMLIVGGSVEAANYALENGIAFNIAGGTHHAFKSRGEGFCLMNDMAITAKWLLKEKKANKVLIIDLDVHQGNGTASILENIPEAFTFSMHGKNNFPHKKERSDLDIELPDGTQDQEYIRLLKDAIEMLIEKAKPDFILYQSGVDVLQSDKLGRLSLTLKGCLQRDEMVLDTAFKNNIPMMAAMGGGYSQDIRIIIEAHAQLYREAVKRY